MGCNAFVPFCKFCNTFIPFGILQALLFLEEFCAQLQRSRARSLDHPAKHCGGGRRRERGAEADKGCCAARSQLGKEYILAIQARKRALNRCQLDREMELGVKAFQEQLQYKFVCYISSYL